MLPGRNLKQTSSVPSVVAFRANAIVRRVRGMGMVYTVTRNASKSPIESEVLKLKHDKRGMHIRAQRELVRLRDAIFLLKNLKYIIYLRTGEKNRKKNGLRRIAIYQMMFLSCNNRV